MSETRVHLSFSIGPVQRFVAQARRTRDLWAGSWLLSHLAEVALAEAERACETAIIPARSDNPPGEVTSTATAIGGMPNRFELAFGTADAAVDAARRAEQAFLDAWGRIAAAVWNKFVADAAPRGNDTEALWERQVNGFWELTWVVGAPAAGEKTFGRLAAARKEFRNVPATKEPGTKCSLMAALQEISGQAVRAKQDRFWQTVREDSGANDLKEGERLCAIALIKRLFPRVIERAVASEGRSLSRELTQQVGWPSTAFFAALPWLKGLDNDARQAAEDFARLAAENGIGMSEYQAAQEAGIAWAGIDAPAWFRNAVDRNEWRVEPDKIEPLRIKLKRLHGRTAPTPYYALLAMDGDSMGTLVAQLGDPAELSRCLGKFANRVGGIVREYDGRTIYAGGDDVLAMLPAARALDAADKLANVYRACFQDTAAEAAATLSAAIVYAHWKFPLRQVLATAHRLLDAIAKGRTGRDALAMGILQGSGLNAVWAAPWAVVRGEPQAGIAVPLRSIIDCFASDDAGRDTAEFNASYLYRLREQFCRLLTGPDQPGCFGRIASEHGAELLLDIAHAEYRRRMTREARTAQPPEQTRPHIERLMALSQQWTRVTGANGTAEIDRDRHAFGFDGWRVARFLKLVKEGKAPDHD